MKKFLILILFCATSILVVPMLIVNPENTVSPSAQITQQANKATTQQKSEADSTIAVFRSLESKTEEITLFEYVCGSVAAEMPLAYNEEAIKAQAVACYTNAIRQKQLGNTKNGDISDDTATHQGYIDVEQRKEKWGESFEKYEKKLQNAIKAVEGEALYYDNKPCVAAFCAISNGKTENAECIWGTTIPYLVSVDSKGDKLSPTYASTVSFTKDEFLKIIEKNGASIEADDIASTVKITEKSDTGTVLKVTVGSKSFTGEEIRKMFSLRSPTFTIKATKNAVTFSVSGYGHGIGMSQYGANYYAEKGYDYKKILEHYYTGVEINKY